MLEGNDLFSRAARGTIAGAAVLACVGLMAVGTHPELDVGRIGAITPSAPGAAASENQLVNRTVAVPFRGTARTK